MRESLRGVGAAREALASFALLLAGGGLLVAGCGGDADGRYPLSGKVTLNGAPVESGSISFQPLATGTTSSGAVIQNGRYAIRDEEGLPVGTYRVVINAAKPGTGKAAPEGVMPGDPLPVPQELIPPEWNVNSQQQIEVQATGPFEFDFAIDAAGGARKAK